MDAEKTAIYAVKLIDGRVKIFDYLPSLEEIDILGGAEYIVTYVSPSLLQERIDIHER